MKKIIASLFLVGLFIGCSSDDARVDNPNLFDVNVNLQVDLSLPQYNSLNFPSNPIFIPGYGNGGIFVMNTGTGSFVAYDAADPNHPQNNNCISMEIDGLRVVCDCEENTYDLFTGNFVQGEDLRFTLYPYRVSVNGNGTIRITN